MSCLGDCDGNQQVDRADFSEFATCIDDASLPSCGCLDLNADAYVDLADFALFQLAFGACP